jgi:ATP-dependent DNA ligase
MRFSELARIYDRVAAAGRDPERVRLLADAFGRADAQTLPALAHFTAGELVAPQFSDRLGIGPGTLRDALVALTGRTHEEIDREVKRTGDLSDVVAALVPRGRDRLTVAGLWRAADRAVAREEDRSQFVRAVFAATDAAGAKYFARMALNQMRIRVGLGTLTRAIAAAFGADAAAVERVYALTNDIGLAASAARRGPRALARTGLALFRPYQFMNAQKVDDPAEIFSALAGKQIIFEIKYDGARLQIHVARGGADASASARTKSGRANAATKGGANGAKGAAGAQAGGRPNAGIKDGAKGGATGDMTGGARGSAKGGAKGGARGGGTEIRLYSRRLNDDTAAMPDIVAALSEAWRGGDAIVEGEAVAFDPSLRKRLPFQSVLMRLGRVHGVAEKAREIPLVLFLFDLLYDRGEDLMRVPQAERRARLERLFRPTARVKMTEAVVTAKSAAQDRYFRRVVRAGHEGLMAKDPEGVYLPGQRAEEWMKIKPAFETLDVVVVGGIYGSGRRRGLLSSLVVAVRWRGEFLTVGKVGTGFSEELLRDLTARLEALVTAARGHEVEIEPRVVIEVDFQDIQKTGRYRAGYVLRIPRFRRERTDKSPREADTVERLRRLYGQTH